jgi:YgiT-type zinc finger domain-containing protein
MKETVIQTELTYTVAHKGQFYIIEHVPARVCRETGEQFFSPETVERIQALAKGGESQIEWLKPLFFNMPESFYD